MILAKGMRSSATRNETIILLSEPEYYGTIGLRCAASRGSGGTPPNSKLKFHAETTCCLRRAVE